MNREPNSPSRLVLVADDDRALLDLLGRGFRKAGYTVDSVSDGVAAEYALRARGYLVAILDSRLPERSGVDVVNRVRVKGVVTAILLLTHRDTPSDRVRGLSAGADDCLIKPFNFAELLERVNAILQRTTLRVGNELTCGDLTLDPVTQQCAIGGRLIKLTMTESAILELLMRRSPFVVSRGAIANHAWQHTYSMPNLIKAHVASLRSKLASSTATIRTVRGQGYQVTVQ
jgi:DNA-binding response OmpR family regulator